MTHTLSQSNQSTIYGNSWRHAQHFSAPSERRGGTGNPQIQKQESFLGKGGVVSGTIAQTALSMLSQPLASPTSVPLDPCKMIPTPIYAFP